MSKEAMKNKLIRQSEDMRLVSMFMLDEGRKIAERLQVLHEMMGGSIVELRAIEPDLFKGEIEQLRQCVELNAELKYCMDALLPKMDELFSTLNELRKRMEHVALPMSPTEPIHFD